ncbi:hypothetical protein IT570_09685 [Candidatus Sumerlaeota bacterium]|nr:hypothetical protein [Candidatus Sumerlaeota bacterium]
MKKNVAGHLLAPGLCVFLAGVSSIGYAEKKLLVEGEIAPATSAQPHPKMTSEFYYLTQSLKSVTREQRSAYTAGLVDGNPNGMCRLKGDQRDVIETYVWLERWDESVRKAVAKAGAEITGEDEARYLIQAWIPLDSLEQVAAIPGVRQLRRPTYGVTASGTVQTEGDTNLNTNFVRSIGRLNGNGIDVGVISRGLFNIQLPYSSLPADQGQSAPAEEGADADLRVATGNLPAYAGNPNDPNDTADKRKSGYLGNVKLFPQTLAVHDVQADPDPETGLATLETTPLAEGGAILETIYDIAPGARLFYADGSTDVDLHTARNFLRGQGVDIIVDDVIFYGSGRFDGTSVISREAQSLVLNNDIVYVVPSGNFTVPNSTSTLGLSVSATRFPIFVNGQFSPRQGATNTKFHNFASASNPTIRDESLTISSQEGFIDVILVWDDNWDDTLPRASDDLDLYLLNQGSMNINQAVASSTDLQNGSGRPIERITAALPFSSVPYSLVISRKDTTNSAPTLFSLVILRGTVDSSDVKYLTHGIPGNNADALPPVISVGAIDAVRGITNVSPESVPGINPGPGRSLKNDFVKWYTTQDTPAVVSYSNTDSVSTQLSSMRRFIGTSAAAAHIGGLVALLRHGFRQVPSYDYYNLLRDPSFDPSFPFPTATQLLVSELSIYKNPPKYYRVNGYDAYVNFAQNLSRAARNAYIKTYGEDLPWQSSGPIDDFNQPKFMETPQGIALSPDGKQDVFGFWQTDLLALPDGDGGTTTELRTDRIYALKVRIGTDEQNPLLVPDFRIRLTTGGSDESALLVVAGENANAANTPNSIGGKEYTLYYRPSNEEVAKQGVRFAFDLIHFDPKDNSNATLYIQDVTFTELEAR